MSATVFLLVLVVGLFVANYLMKRRFGVLGLALAAGALISNYWAESLAIFLQGQGLELLQFHVEIVLTLLPALILLFGGPTYGKLHMRIIGSALFTLLALALVLTPVASLMSFDEAGTTIYRLIHENQGVIIVVSLLVAVGDVFVGRSPGGHKLKKQAH